MNNGLLYFPPDRELVGPRILQIVETQDRNGDATGAGDSFASDDLVPAITQGRQYTALNTPFTPKSNRSRLSIEMLLPCTVNAPTTMGAGVWKDSNVDCLAFATLAVGTNDRSMLALRHFIVTPAGLSAGADKPAGLNAMLFTVRFGYIGGAVTLRVSSSATPNWGGTQYSSLRITEYLL